MAATFRFNGLETLPQKKSYCLLSLCMSSCSVQWCVWEENQTGRKENERIQSSFTLVMRFSLNTSIEMDPLSLLDCRGPPSTLLPFAPFSFWNFNSLTVRSDRERERKRDFVFFYYSCFQSIFILSSLRAPSIESSDTVHRTHQRLDAHTHTHTFRSVFVIRHRRCLHLSIRLFKHWQMMKKKCNSIVSRIIFHLIRSIYFLRIEMFVLVRIR